MRRGNGQPAKLCFGRHALMENRSGCVRIEGRNTPGLDARTTRHASYRVSQRTRKHIEKILDWLKAVGGMRKGRVIGIARTQMQAHLAASVYNLLRMSRLVPIGTS